MPDIAPRVPDGMAAANFMKFWLFADCDVPFLAYIEFARPIANEIACELLMFDLRDMIKNLIRPAGHRSSGHSRNRDRRGTSDRRKRRGGARRGGGIPELSDMAADILDPHKDIRPKVQSQATRFLFVFDDIWQRVAWTIYLAEAIDRLTMGPILGVAFSQNNYCPNIGRFYGYRQSDLTTGLFGWVAASFDSVVFANLWNWQSNFGCRPQNAGEHVFVYSSKCWNDDEDKPVTIGLRIIVDGEVAAQEFTTCDVGEISDIVCTAKVKQNQHVQWEHWVEPGGTCRFIDSNFVGLQIKDG